MSLDLVLQPQASLPPPLATYSPDPILNLTLNATSTRLAVAQLAACPSVCTATLASVNDLKPEVGATRPPAAAPSFISTSVGDLFTGPYPNPNPKRDPDHRLVVAKLAACPSV